MTGLPQDGIALFLAAFLFGMKHGFDADHLATIDGLTRYNQRTRPSLARFCGVLFSIGHGAVVIATGLLVGAVAQHWQAPVWLETTGAVISISILAALGVLNIIAVVRTDPRHVVVPVGIKGRWLRSLSKASSPGLVALVGALFALSFDTLSQATLFSVAGLQMGGWTHALGLGLLFTIGMLVTDGINGYWISRLICRADQIALVASRVMSLAVAGVSLLVAGFGLAKILSPVLDTWSEGKDTLFGALVLAAMLASFVLAAGLGRRPLNG